MNKKEMRQVLAEILESMMAEDENLIVMDADLAKAVGTAGLYKKFPKQTLNMGIAEASMISTAAGLTTYGYTPLTFTFATFATRRVADQIAQSVCFAKSNVKIFGGDPGVTAQINGATHMAIEDVGVLRSIPDIVIFEPSDCVMMADLLPQMISHQGPVYTRLLRKAPVGVYENGTKFEPFKIHVAREGSDITLAASGIMVAQAMAAADRLATEGISAEVLDVHTIKPLDTETLLVSLEKTKAVVTCENHNVLGGLGSAVAEAAAKAYPVPMEFIGIQDHFGQAADQDYLMEKFRLTPNHIVAAAKKAVERKER